MHLSDSDRIRLTDEIVSASARAGETNRRVPYAATVDIEPVDLPGLLDTYADGAIWYWRSRDGEIEIAGVGTGMTIAAGASGSSLQMVPEMSRQYPLFRPLIFCTRRFNPAEPHDEFHRYFPGDICSVPLYTVVRKGDHYSLRSFMAITADTDVDEALVSIETDIDDLRLMNPSRRDRSLPSIETVRSYPDRDGWRKNIDNALAAMSRSEIDKVVLARRLDYRFAENIDPLSLMMLLREHNRSCYSFLYQPRPGMAFVSATPERLYLREGDRISVDAVSSTMPRGATPAEDAMLERQLLHDDKLRREHRYVAETILADLAPLCDSQPAAEVPSALKLDRIQHIASMISGQLKPGVDDAQIVDTLHPTPAVAGVPRDRAIAMISQMEGFNRNWYAGAIGIIDGDSAEFTVGIRSAFVMDNVVTVFTGAGIVRGSDPDREWEEIESKDILRPLLPERALS